jgi:TPR repeat protein
MYKGGFNGVAKNKAKADELLTKACSMGHQSSCPKT